MNQQDTTQIIIKPNQLEVGDINVSTTQLRTPVMQVDDHQPLHLNQRESVFAPIPVSYQKLSHNDSIFLNLIPAKSDQLFDAELSFETLLPTKEAPITATSQTVEKTLADSVKKNQLNANKVAADSIKTITIQPSSTPIKIRSSNQFEGSKEWLSGFILVAILIAGLVKLTSGKYLNDIFSSIRYQQSASKLFSTFNVQNQKPGWALSFLFILSTSLLVFEYTLVMGRQPESGSNFIFLLSTFGGILLYFLFKNAAYRFVGFVFDTMTDTKAYLFNSDLLNKSFGLAMLPIVSIVPFVDQRTASVLLKLGLVLFSLMYIVQLLRGVKIILRSPLSIFYMFLYFCALEILPLSILIKTMIL